MGDSALRLEMLEPRRLLSGLTEIGPQPAAQEQTLPVVNVVATVSAALELGPVAGEFTFTRSGSTDLPLTIFYELSGTAAADADYVAPSGSITIPAGTSLTKLPIMPVDDALNEGNETVTLSLLSDDTYLLGTGTGDSVILIDDDTPRVPRGTISGVVFDDHNGDGDQDTGEPGLFGITVELLQDVNANGQVDESDLSLRVNTTDSAGHYAFGILEAGQYLVRITDAKQLLDTFLLSADAETVLQPLQNNQVVNNLDFGYFDPTTLTFGTTPTQTRKVLDFKGVTYRMTGPGQGTLQLDDEGDVSLLLTDTTNRTGVRIQAARGVDMQLHGVLVTGSVRDVQLKRIDLTGEYRSIGVTRQLTVQDITDAQIHIGAGLPREDFKLTARDVKDSTLDTEVALRRLKVHEWLDGDAVADQIIAPAAAVVQSRGDFQSDLTLHSPQHRVSLGSLLVSGALSEATIRSVNDIVNVRARTVVDAMILAGVSDSISELPDEPAAFINPHAQIRSVVIRGDRSEDFDFSQSVIAAGQLGSVSLKRIDPDNAGASFGITADSIRSLRYNLGQSRSTLLSLDDPISSTSHQDFLLQLIDSST